MSCCGKVCIVNVLAAEDSQLVGAVGDDVVDILVLGNIGISSLDLCNLTGDIGILCSSAIVSQGIDGFKSLGNSEGSVLGTECCGWSSTTTALAVDGVDVGSALDGLGGVALVVGHLTTDDNYIALLDETFVGYLLVA